MMKDPNPMAAEQDDGQKTGPELPGSLQRRCLGDVGMWLLYAAEEPKGYEILIRGDANAPAAEALALLEGLLPKLDGLVRQGADFLDLFVDRGRFASANDWYFTGILIGRYPNDPASQFWLTYGVEGDTYGEWSVAMSAFQARVYPTMLCRRTF
jgi:hypothetical protein